MLECHDGVKTIAPSCVSAQALAPDLPAPITSHNRNAKPPVRWARLGIAGLALAVATPTAALLTVWLAALVTGGLAAAWAVSNAPEPELDVSHHWDLRFVYVGVLLAIGARAGVSRLPKPGKVGGFELRHWWLGLGGLAFLSGGAALAGEQWVVDLDDSVHVVLLTSCAVWTFLTASWLMVSAAHAGLVAVALAAGRSRALGWSVAAIGLASLAVASPVLANPRAIESDDVYRDAPLVGAAIADLEGSTRALAGASSGSTTSSGSGGGISGPTEYGMAECMEAVATPREDAPSVLSETVRKLKGRYRSRAHEVLDIARDKMIDVCADDPPPPPSKLSAFLYTATRAGIVDRIRKGRSARWGAPGRMGASVCLIDGSEGMDSAVVDHRARSAMVADALAQLSANDLRLVQEHYLLGSSYEVMAALRGKKTDTVGKATRRAVAKIFEHFRASCRP